MAQHGIGAGGKHRGHPAAPVTRSKMTNGVDAMLNAVQQPTRKSVSNRPTSHPETKSCAATDNSVLLPPRVSNTTIEPNSTVERTRGTLCMPDMRNVPLASTALIVTGLDARVVRRMSRKAHEKRLQPAGTASGFDPLK